MNTTIAGWISVLGAGATAASAAIVAGPLDTRTAVVAVCAFFGGAGLAAKALYVQKPGTPPQG
jgi:hypothetical protein